MATAIAEKSNAKAQAWFCTTGLPSDVVIEVGDMSFHLHKFPMISRSKKLHQLIMKQDQNPKSRRAAAHSRARTEEGPEEETAVREEEEGGEREEEIAEEEEEEATETEMEYHIPLPDFPGEADAFEMAAKFCYGVKVDLTPSNVVPIRCAAEFLEMTDDISHDNLISRSERYLTQSVLRSIKESVRALRSCDGPLLPMAEELGIVQRCIDTIAAKASSSDPSSLFGWPMNEATAGGIVDRRVSDRILWNGIDARIRRKNGISGRSSSAAATAAVLADSWCEDLTTLSLPLYKRVISAMKARDLSSDVIEGSLISYAKRSIPGLSRSSRKSAAVPLPSESEQLELLETVITNLPLQKSAASTTMRFLFGLLRTVNILRASDRGREALERKIGSQLEQATLDDLLMPSYSYLVETLYDVDCVVRLLQYFLESLQERAAITAGGEEEGDGMAVATAAAERSPRRISPLMMVGKLIDGYLSEIASDVNLKPDKFCSLAFALPEQARVYDDGLYRAVDVYLKAHPRLSGQERERVCGVMDCQKLTLEACTHAAQNERLPLRAIVQVLFFEQLQLRHAISGSLFAADVAAGGGCLTQQFDSGRISWNGTGAVANRDGGGGAWRTAVRDNQVLRLDMDSMRSRVQELEKECSSMKKAIEKIDKSALLAAAGGRAGGARWGSSLSKKFGCKFRTQVCDSHERNIVEARRCSRDEEEQST